MLKKLCFLIQPLKARAGGHSGRASIYRTVFIIDYFYQMKAIPIGNPIVEIRRFYDRLISTMGFPILVRWHLYIESGPRALLSLNIKVKKKSKSNKHIKLISEQPVTGPLPFFPSNHWCSDGLHPIKCVIQTWILLVQGPLAWLTRWQVNNRGKAIAAIIRGVWG